jgi:CO dehydrogenase/acetyl-CoA synthase beta subunit
MFEMKQPDSRVDLKTLLDRIRVIHDIISYNKTMNLSKKYEVWIDVHHGLIDELEHMIIEDLGRL